MNTQDFVQLSRVDILQVGATSRRAMRVLPSKTERKQQKIVVGDATGVIQCFSLKKSDLVSAFKTIPTSKAITSVSLGGSLDMKLREKVFYATGQTIKGMSKMGKEFFRFDTNLTEPIMHMVVEVPNVWTSGEYIFNHFLDGKETGYYICPDKINDIVVGHVVNDRDWNPVLGCQDRFVRVLQGQDLLFELAVEGPVTCVCQYEARSPYFVPTFAGTPADASAAQANAGLLGLPPGLPGSAKVTVPTDGARQLLYGTENGVFGQIFVTAMGMKKGWTVQAPPNAPGGRASGVTALCINDFSKDGINDIIVGRDNGDLEMYGFDVSPDEPRLIFHRSLGESVTAIDHGLITGPNSEDLVVSTYSGKIIAFTADREAADEVAVSAALSSASTAVTESSGGTAASLLAKGVKLVSSAASTGSAPPTVAAAAAALVASGRSGEKKKVRALRAELDKLREKVDQSKEKYMKMSSEMVPVHTEYQLKDRLVLDADDSSYHLSIELDVPIDCVLLSASSDAPVELLDSEGSVALVSRTPASEGRSLLATYRCVESMNRIEIKLRTREGGAGTLEVFVVPSVSPKVSHATSYSIKPLCLHQRTHTLTDESRPMNELRITGTFTLSEMHSWICLCLPDVPERLHEQEEVVFFFRSTFQGTQLVCKYRKGEAVFRSDNVSTISIVKDFIAKEATTKKVRLNINYDIRDETFGNVLRLLHPKLSAQIKMSEQAALIEALKEIKIQEEDVSFLSTEYRDILERAQSIEKDIKTQPSRLQFISDIVTNLYLDKCKFRGQSGQAKVPVLQQVLKSYSLEKLVDFFERS